MNYTTRTPNKQRKSGGFLKFFTVFVLLIGLIVSAFILYDIRREDESSRSAASGRNEVSFVAGTQTFDTPYFTFSVNGNWQFLDAFSEPGRKYRYTEFIGETPKRHFVVYINDTYQREYDRVLAVNKTTDNGLSVQHPISDHCSGQEIDDNTVGQRVVTLNGVRFLCNVDGTSYEVAAGLVGGTVKIEHDSAASEEPLQYLLFYDDVSFTHEGSVFENIVENFTFK